MKNQEKETTKATHLVCARCLRNDTLRVSLTEQEDSLFITIFCANEQCHAPSGEVEEDEILALLSLNITSVREQLLPLIQSCSSNKKQGELLS